MAEPIQNLIKIDIIRREKGISIAELAETAGVNKRMLEDWFQRRRVAKDVYTLQKLARVLECSIEELIEPEESYKKSDK